MVLLVGFQALQNTPWPFSRTRNSWHDAENDDNFPEISADSLAEKNWVRNKVFRIYFYRNNSLFSYILSSLQSILKTICDFCKYFGWILFANIGLQRFSFEFRRKFCNVISLTHHFIIKSRRLILRHSCPKICSFAQKGRRTVSWAWVL